MQPSNLTSDSKKILISAIVVTSAGIIVFVVGLLPAIESSLVATAGGFIAGWGVGLFSEWNWMRKHDK